jgi:hypothetical protein
MGFPSGRFDDQAEEDVVRVRVGGAATGSERRLVCGRDRNELARLPDDAVIASKVGREHLRVLEVVVEAAPVTEQLMDRDPLSTRDETR